MKDVFSKKMQEFTLKIRFINESALFQMVLSGDHMGYGGNCSIGNFYNLMTFLYLISDMSDPLCFLT